jgi:EAL domain-containing protein (putative c-di-GMP-specific phosphodiesterase class I)
VTLAIDDFGTGYASLTTLRRLHADCVKIDRSFTVGLGSCLEDTAIAGSIIALAHALGLSVVAEGVETAEQLECLKEMGCDLVQGYYLAKPLPSEEVERILAATG